jgi:predicted AAA+ superfamily ATPase
VNLEELLIYGSYPAIVSQLKKGDKESELKKIATNYLYKDIYIFEAIRNPKTLEDLLLQIAYSLGSTVSTRKLANELGVSTNTVERYIRLLEQSFVIKRMYSYSKNFANELKKSYKVYFFDNGIRNALIPEFELNDKNKGALLENYFVMEMFKKGYLKIFPPKYYFWRTRQGLEIDLVFEEAGQLKAFECKYSNQEVKFTIFKKYYPNAEANLVTMENIQNFLQN